jgi:hypothetical protein
LSSGSQIFLVFEGVIFFISVSSWTKPLQTIVGQPSQALSSSWKASAFSFGGSFYGFGTLAL